jgi:predicted RNase H-like HicB family nuclease
MPLILATVEADMDLAYTYWQDDGWYLGYLNDYPKHWTQGKDLAGLQEMLLDLHEIFQKDAIATKAERKTWVLKVPA